MSPDYRIDQPEALLSPSLVIFRDLVRQNLASMINLVGTPNRLRPHVKTHKMPAIVRLCEESGIHKHKCATIAEAEMLARAGAGDVLISYPLVGPNLARLAQLVATYPATTFRATVDSPSSAQALSDAFANSPQPLSVLVDLEVGMGRTGLPPGPDAVNLYKLIAELPHLEPGGLHSYDGHLQILDLQERTQAAQQVQQMTLALRDQIQALGLDVPRLVFGGTPTFPIHAALDAPNVECSPGTCILHDHGYGSRFPDLPFVPAALVFTRVVSHPRPDRLCLDVGHKAVAGDPPAGTRVFLPDLPEAEFPTHSEEHLVAVTPRTREFPIGTPLLGIPSHICPTCALHRRAYVIENGALVDEWEVAARDRVLTI